MEERSTTGTILQTNRRGHKHTARISLMILVLTDSESSVNTDAGYGSLSAPRTYARGYRRSCTIRRMTNVASGLVPGVVFAVSLPLHALIRAAHKGRRYTMNIEPRRGSGQPVESAWTERYPPTRAERVSRVNSPIRRVAKSTLVRLANLLTLDCSGVSSFKTS